MSNSISRFGWLMKEGNIWLLALLRAWCITFWVVESLLCTNCGYPSCAWCVYEYKVYERGLRFMGSSLCSLRLLVIVIITALRGVVEPVVFCPAYRWCSGLGLIPPLTLVASVTDTYNINPDPRTRQLELHVARRWGVREVIAWQPRIFIS
jgi:hypothetical protein